MAATLYPISGLDANQVLQHAYDETQQALRTNAQLTFSGNGGVEVTIDQADDSIRIGDGTNLVSTTVYGSKVGLDVVSLNSIVPKGFDSIYPTYPTPTVEIYNYKFLGSTVATVTVTYVDSTKNELVSIVRT